MNTTAPRDGTVAHHSGPHGMRYAVSLPPEPRRTHQRHLPGDHPDAGDFSSRPTIQAENNMVAMNEHLALDAGMTGPRACVDAESFSGYIITTSTGTR